MPSLTNCPCRTVPPQTETLQETLLRSKRGTNDGFFRRFPTFVCVATDAERSAVCGLAIAVFPVGVLSCFPDVLVLCRL